MTDERLKQIRKQYHRIEGIIVPVEVRVISDLLDYIDEREKTWKLALQK